MGAIFLIVLLLLLGGLTAGIVFTLRVGMKALPPSGSSGEFVAVRRFLALNLCEPALNIVVVPVVAYVAITHAWHGNVLYTGLAFTWPMAVLLVPALGLRFRDPLYRAASLKILALGLGRWFITALIFGLGGRSDGGMSVALLLFLVGCGLLIYSFVWGHGQLTGPLEDPSLLPLASSPPADLRAQIASAVSAARVAKPAPPIVVYPPDPGVRCPVCHAPSSLRDGMCAACGLVFVSRVPTPFRQLEGYAVLRPLEIGGMSHIYLARAHASGQLCAVKALAAVDETVGAEAFACLRREAALLQRLDHPQLVRALEWRDDNAPCLVMPYVPGPTLEAVALPLPHEIALSYAISVADALCYLHALPEPVAHCDIKPGNLLLPPGGQPILVDFGSATAHDADSVAPERYGTPGYAAPEQYRGSPAPASDIYGLGATLYHLLTGDDPASHPLVFPQLDQLPPPIATLLDAMLQHEPAQRPCAATVWETLLGLLK